MTDLSQKVAHLLDASVEKLVAGQDVAIAFSGGIDSSLVAALAKKHARSVHLYVVGTRGSHDPEEAAETAPKLGLDLTVIGLDDRDIVDNLREQISVTGTDSPLTLAFEMPLYCVLKNCPEGIIMGGQGADELFGGYSKYLKMKDLQMREEMVKDYSKLITSTKPHEAKMAERFGKTVKYAFLDREIVALMRNTPIADIRAYEDEDRKHVLKDVARDLGLDFLCEKQKKAAQYGSGTMDSVRRVCKERGTTYNELVSDLIKHKV